MNFLEGTRFSSAIQTKQQSPYQYLLKPKAGGIALALSVLSDKFHSLLDITIVYPDGVPTFWQFLCGQVKRITVRIEQVELPLKFLHGDYESDPVFRAEFQQLVQQLWQKKDRLIQTVINDAGNNKT